MRTLYCFNNSGIKFQTTNETEFLQYEIQAKSKGLEVCIGEYFPYQREISGSLKLDSNDKPISLSDANKLQLGIIGETEMKSNLKNRIRSKMDFIANSVQANYTSAEKQSFPAKELEANEYQAEKRTMAECIVLTNEANAIFGNSFTTAQFNQIVSRVLSKSVQFKTLVGTLAGIRSKLEARIDSGDFTIDIDAEFAGLI